MDRAASQRSPWLVVLVMCVGYFLVLLDVTIVNVSLPRIGADLSSGVSGLQWVVDGYAVALAALLLAGGTIGDRHGHKRVVLVGLGLFGLASVGCGLAPGVGALIGARVVQGVGAALLLPGTLAIISNSFADRADQARAIGIWAGVGALALPAGPLLGGALVATVGWRAVFFVNVPVVVVAGVGAARWVPENVLVSPRRPDRAGVLLAAVSLIAVTFAVIEVGHVGPTPRVLAAGAVATIAIVGFVVCERRAAEPMLPLDLFRHRAFTTANAVAGAMNLGTLGLLLLVTLYLQTVQGRDPLSAGLALLPAFVPLALLAPWIGRVTARIGPKIPMVLGLVIATGGVALLARLQPSSAYPEVLPALLAWGVGLGVLTPAVVAAAVAAVDPSRSGLASGVNNTARQAGGAIGIAAYGAIAGTASNPGTFVEGIHLAALATAGLFLAAALASLSFIPSGRTAP